MQCRAMFRFLLACLGLMFVGGCVTPQQYVYNCTPHAVAIDGKTIAARTFASRSSGSAGPGASYPDGSVRPLLRVSSSQVDSFGLSNAWISPANVSRQFKAHVVIVDLR